MKRSVVDIMGGAVRADGFRIIAHVYEDMRMIERRQSADTHEFFRANPHLGETRLVVKMGCDVIGHNDAPRLFSVAG